MNMPLAKRAGRSCRRTSQAQRGGVRPQRVVGHECRGHQIGRCGRHPGIDMLAEVAVGPAIEAAVAHRGQVVGHQVAAQFVALVDHGPQAPRLGSQAMPFGLRRPLAKIRWRRCADIDFPDGGALGLHRHAAFGDVAVRAHRHIQLAAVRAGDQVLGPVVVDRPAGRSPPPWGRHRDAGVAGGVRKAQHRIGVGHVELVAHQRHAEGRVQPSSSTERRSATPSPSVSRSRVMRLALGTPAPALHHQAHHPALDAQARRRAWAAHWSRPPAHRHWAAPAASADDPDRAANALTRVPGAGWGTAPGGQPTAGAMFTVGASPGDPPA
jgi:hypothetical protein